MSPTFATAFKIAKGVRNFGTVPELYRNMLFIGEHTAELNA